MTNYAADLKRLAAQAENDDRATLQLAVQFDRYLESRFDLENAEGSDDAGRQRAARDAHERALARLRNAVRAVLGYGDDPDDV